MKWLRNLLQSDQPAPKARPHEVAVNRKPSVKREVLDFKELSIISSSNVRYLRALINTKDAFIKSMGKREALKRRGEIEKLREKLAEEEFYAEYYNNQIRFHAEGV